MIHGAFPADVYELGRLLNVAGLNALDGAVGPVAYLMHYANRVRAPTSLSRPRTDACPTCTRVCVYE